MTPLPVCATVLESSLAATRARLAALAEDPPELIELRLDALPPAELDPAALRALVEAAPAPVLATCRPRREGGGWEGPEPERLALLQGAAVAGAAWVDVEADAADALPLLPAGARLLVSSHPSAVDAGDEAALRAALARVRHPRADAQKLALPLQDACQGLALLRLAQAEPAPTIAIGMGFPGVVTRLAGTRHGAPWTYAAADPARPAAPGQLPLAQLRALVPRRPRQSTRLYGVIGRPVGHSRSPELMNAAFAELGEDAVYTWLETADPRALLEEAWLDERSAGFSVTIPHKAAAARAPRVELDTLASAIGAINTLTRSAQGWVGTNTDALAARQLVLEACAARGLEPSELPVALLGYGGAARAVAVALRELGAAEVAVYGRSAERGQAFAAALGCRFAGPLSALGPAAGPRLILNATSVGMRPGADQSPVAAECFDARAIAYDLVYTPAETRFLAEAEARGAHLVSGVAHFVAQAQAQLRAWLGERAARLEASWLRRALG